MTNAACSKLKGRAISQNNQSFERNEVSGAYTRRKFLIAGGAAVAGLSLSGCFSFSGTKASGNGAGDLVDDALRAQMLALFEDICQWITTLGLDSGVCKVPDSKEESPFTWVNGNLARVLLVGDKILGRPAYRTVALVWLDLLASRQQLTTTSTGLAAGFWGDRTGPGNLYLADTGTAMTAMALGYQVADRERQRNYLAAMERFVRFIQHGSKEDPQGQGRGATTSWIIKTGKDKGALGCGYYQGHLSTSPYIISTAITEIEFLAVLETINHDSNLIPMVKDGVRWLLKQQLPTGEFPYLIDGQTAELHLWPLDTMTYVCEGLIAAYLYLNDAALRREIAETLKASVEWLLRTQNENGTWGKMKSADQQRSPGCVTLLVWYDRNVEADPRIAVAVRKYCQFLLVPANRQIYGCKELLRTTGFIGLVLANLLKPNVTFE
jgi:hypothetical protein